MPVEFKLPDLGEGVAEGEIVGWRVQEGDTIVEDQPLVEVMTDKVTVEIPSPVAGRVLEILAREGDVIPVGTPMILLEDGTTATTAETVSRAPAAAPVERGRPAAGREAENGDGHVRAVPLVRRLAREMQVDLATVTGTGPAGRITEADVRAAAGAPKGAEPPRRPGAPAEPPRPYVTPVPRPILQPPSTTTGSEPGLEERIPFRGIRRRIAERLVHSLHTTAPFTFVDEVDMTELVAAREAALPWAEQRGVKLTYLPFVIKALIAALREHPALNATVDEENAEIVLKRYYHIGVATHTEEGLVVPVVRDADRKSLWQLSAEIEALAVKARTGSLSLDEIQDGTFTITSLGILGGLMATPIINPPEVAILGVHQIRQRPAVHQGQLAIRQIAHLSLTFDHRVIDGHVGAEFVRTMIRYLEHPTLLMLAED
jgi:pyruvate dehydrogenase E2 component (dihydrolipoamide acetyltransferase)